MEDKKLELTARLQSYVDKKTGQPGVFPVFEVEIHGLKLQLKASDRTSQALLAQYFGIRI